GPLSETPNLSACPRFHSEQTQLSCRLNGSLSKPSLIPPSLLTAGGKGQLYTYPGESDLGPFLLEDMTSWQIDSNGGDRWKVESLPGDHGTDFPDSRVKKYFVTSFGMCLKSQLVDLKAEGYGEELLDTFRPDIVVKDWFAARADCGCTYHLRVQLASADYIVLASFEPPPVTIDQWNNAKWTEVSYTFSDYPPGVRHILFQHGGKDTQFWAGWYGPRVTNSSIVISPKMTRNLAPCCLPALLPSPQKALL
uniref:F-box protein 6 n=1 Tax=Panthera tigris altaica TaxID=74533 RepID=A0A8C9K4P4_PANTA